MSFQKIFRGRSAFFFSVAGLVAACGGLNLAVFSLANALWLRPVPVNDAERVFVVNPSTSNLKFPVYESFEAIADQVAGGQNQEPVLRFPDQPWPPEVMGVTPNYFRLFGLDIRGRNFTEEDNRVGAEVVAVISDRFWSRAFDRRSEVIGSVVPSDPVSVRIIGVAPPGFEGAQRGERTDIWFPRVVFPRLLRLQPGTTALQGILWVRLARGDTVAEAEARLAAAFQSPRTLLPVREIYGTPSTRTTLLRDGGATWVVAGLGCLVLIGACAALASLLLVHFERRRLEFGIRAALGASSGRLIRSVIGEVAAIGFAGTLGAAAVAELALRGIGGLRLQLPAGVDFTRLDLSFDWRVVLAGLTLTTLTLAIAALLPMARLTHGRLLCDLASGPTVTASRASQRLRQGLLGVLVCATTIVLVSAMLFVRSVHRAYSTSPGFDVGRLIFVSVPITPFRTSVSDDFRSERVRLVREALRGLPGVEVAAISGPPFGETRQLQARNTRTLSTRGRVHRVRAPMMLASPEVLAALGVPIVAGRDLTPADIGAHPRPIVVTNSLARTLWPSETPLGQSFGDGYYVVVGVAKDFLFGSLAAPADGVIVVPTFDNSAVAQFILRVSRTDRAVVDDLRRLLSNVLRDTPPATALTGRELIERDLGRQRLGAWFFSGFGLVALWVGVGSVFGMVAYLIESRRREFGVRLALGASSSNLIWHGMSAALLPVSIGLGVGLVAAAGVSRLFEAMLVGVTGLDLLSYLAVAAILLSAAAAAALVAASRLRLLAPVEALRTS